VLRQHLHQDARLLVLQRRDQLLPLRPALAPERGQRVLHDRLLELRP